MPHKDPYEILGVGRGASADEVKRAYRHLAKEHHPDRNAGDKHAEGKFKEVQAAYEVLGDPQRREQFDRFGAGGPPPDFQTWTAGAGPRGADVSFDFGNLGDLSGIFEQFFNRGGPRRRTRRTPAPPRRRGANIEHAIELTFEQACRGVTREIARNSSANRAPKERIEFRVPAGVDDRQRIRVAGQGQDGPGGRGDLIIVCRVRPHPRWRREGLDLHCDLPLRFDQAVLGARVDVGTLDGETRVTVPPGTSGGAKLRLRGRGIVDGASGKTGDMYLTVRVCVPADLSPRARALIEELADELAGGPGAASGVHEKNK